MRRRPGSTTAAPLFMAAALSYGANCALGTSVAVKLIDTSGFRWLHHALYVATCVSTAAAIIAGWFGKPREASRRAAMTLLPAALPLGVIPWAGTRGTRHPLVALA